MRIIALGGLLQGPTLFPSNWQAKDLSHYRGSLNDAAEQLCDEIPPGNNVLVGYSLGGRLALHALVRRPHLWKAAALLSTNPGLERLIRGERYRQDCSWAHRFLTEDLDVVLQDWNRQEVFGGHVLKSPVPSKKEIARRLIEWSLGVQEDLRGKISELQIPLLWAAGERDAKFSAIAKTLAFSNPSSEIWICPQSGHRLVEERGKDVVFHVENFFKNKI